MTSTLLASMGVALAGAALALLFLTGRVAPAAAPPASHPDADDEAAPVTDTVPVVGVAMGSSIPWPAPDGDNAAAVATYGRADMLDLRRAHRESLVRRATSLDCITGLTR